MSKIVFAFVCLALLQIAIALECHSCSGPSCESETKTWQKVKCGDSGTSVPTNGQWYCQKLVYKDKTTQKKMVERRCIINVLKDGKPNTTCPTALGEPIECPLCQEDRCNSAPATSLSFATLCGLTLAILGPKLL